MIGNNGPIIINPREMLKIFGRILDFGKKAIDFLINGDDVKNQSAMDTENSSAEDTMNLNSVLLNYRKKVKDETRPIEENVKEACKEVFSSICDSVDFANSKFQIYKADSLKRRLDDITEAIDGIFEKHVAKRISLDDETCTDILKMMPGELKGQRMAELKEAVLKEAIDDICIKINKFEEDIFDSMEISANSRLEGMEKLLLDKNAKFNEISQNSVDVNKKIELARIKSYYILSLIDLAKGY